MLNVLDQTEQDIVGGVAVDATGAVYWISATDEITKQPLSGNPVSYTYTPTSVGLGGVPLLVGPDGNIWTTIYDDTEIIKMTTSGVFTKYTTAGGCVSLTNGPDGNLWFVDQGTNKIGKITTSGTITEYSITAGHTAVAIVAGSDGLLYAATVNGSIHTILKSYNTSGVQQASSDLGAFFAGSLMYRDSEGNFWIQSALANEAFIKSTPDGIATTLSLPIEAGTNQVGQLLFLDGRFVVTGSYTINSDAYSIAVVDNNNQLVGSALYPYAAATTDYIAQSPINQYIYTVNSNGSPTALTIVEEILDVQLRETDKAKKDQY